MAGRNKRQFLTRSEIDELRLDFKGDDDMKLLCDMALMALRFFEPERKHTMEEHEGVMYFFSDSGETLDYDEVLDRINMGEVSRRTLQEVYDAVGHRVMSQFPLPQYIKDRLGMNPGRSILRQLLAKNISIGKMGELMGLEPGEINDLKRMCGAFEEEADKMKQFLKGEISFDGLARHMGLSDQESIQFMRRVLQDTKLNA